MSTQKKEFKKDAATLLHLCKDLHKYIKRKIINQYVFPNSKEANDDKNIQWKYYKTDPKVTDEEKIFDIYKDDNFLLLAQKCYFSLKDVIDSLEEDKSKIKCLNEQIEVGEHKIKLLSQLNDQLNNFFASNDGKGSNKINTNDNGLKNHLSLMKSFNILNDFNLINSINDLNKDNPYINNNNTLTTIIKNNNIILDNNIINNNRPKDDCNKTIHSHTGNENILPECMNSQNNNVNLKNNSSFGLDNKLLQNKKKRQEQNDYQDDFDKSHFEKINNNFNFSKNQNVKKENNSFLNNQNKTNNQNNSSKQQNMNSNSSQINNSNNGINSNSSTNNNLSGVTDNNQDMEVEFEKILRNEFSYVFSNDKNNSMNVHSVEITKLLKKICTIKFNRNNKFEEPYLTGSYKHFEIKYLCNSLPAIDIIFKCKEVKNINEISDISKEMFTKKLHLNYLEIDRNYDKQNEIVKVTNKCKIKIGNDANIFVFINLLFVNIKLSSYESKEKNIQQFLFDNNIYNNKNRILISLFFRKWRRKYKLYFIMPELLDIIIYFYYNEKFTIPLVIENIFFDLFSGEINLKSENNKENKNEQNITNIMKFIQEWNGNDNFKTALNNAIIETQEYLIKREFLSIFKVNH